MGKAEFCSPGTCTEEGKISGVPDAPGSLVVFNGWGCGKERLNSQVLYGIILVREGYDCVALLVDLDIGLLQVESADWVVEKKKEK